MAKSTTLSGLEVSRISYARSALQTCITTHGGICAQSRSHLLQPQATESPPFPTIVNLAVLNVHTLQIEEISFNDAFLALSYVWGRESDTVSWKHTDGNGTVWIRGDRLPPTLADAIALCRNLDQKYIWVDQICIDQKNPAALTSLIHNMDRIYASALATIIVACNDGADERIACRAEFLYNVDLGLDMDLWQGELQRSRWSERAWTYQEMQLSRRLLVITLNGLFYHCAKQGISLPIWSLPSVQDVSCWSAYSTIVTEYTSRRLTQKIDTLNAIDGMIKSLARFADDRFLAGIPSKLIHCGLLWQPTAPCVRQSQWPSWSWAGWTGHEQSMCTIIYPSDGHFQSYDADSNSWPGSHGAPRFARSLRHVEFHVPGSDVQLKLGEENLSSGARSRYRQRCDNKCTFPCSQLAHLGADQPFHENGILTFTAEIMKIRIEPTRQRSPRFPQLYQCHLLIGEKFVGSMFLPEDHLPTQTIVDAEFIVLTSLRSFCHVYETEVFGGMFNSDSGTAAFDESFLKRARQDTVSQYQGWIAGRFHSQRGWKEPTRDYIREEVDDPHRGMPYPSTIPLRHVLWIVKDEEQDLAFRKGLGIVIPIQGGHEETVRLA